MGKQDRQLSRKLDEWTAGGLISSAQATAIRDHEAKANPGRPWGIIVFAGFGAIILGMGIILLFAYNWAAMPKFAKLGVVFGVLAAAHGGGLRLRRQEATRGFGEALSLLGTMLFGAGIWLVAQVYHISAHYPNAYLAWAAGALLMAWALPSVSQGLLAAVLLAIWGCTEAFGFGNQMLIAPLVILPGIGLLAWQQRSPVLLTAAATTLAFTCATSYAFDESSAALVIAGVTLFYCASAWLARDQSRLPQASAILRITALLMYYPLLFVFTFHGATDDLLDARAWWWARADVLHWLPCLLLPVAGLITAAVAIVLSPDKGSRWTTDIRNNLLAPTLLVTAIVIGWTVIHTLPADAADRADSLSRVAILDLISLGMCGIATILYLYHTGANLWIGCKETRLQPVVAGSLLLAAWVFARFADMFDSLLARGIMFMVMGAALFAVAIFYHRQKKHRQTTTGDNDTTESSATKGA